MFYCHQPYFTKSHSHTAITSVHEHTLSFRENFKYFMAVSSKHRKYVSLCLCVQTANTRIAVGRRVQLCVQFKRKMDVVYKANSALASILGCVYASADPWSTPKSMRCTWRCFLWGCATKWIHWNASTRMKILLTSAIKLRHAPINKLHKLYKYY